MITTIRKYLPLAGGSVEITAKVEADSVDHGIGAYEYWGARGVDHNYGWEIAWVGELRLIAIDELPLWPRTRKQRRKAQKRIRTAFRRLDPNDEAVFNTEELEEACDAHKENSL